MIPRGRVKVYPHGSPEMAAEAEVLISCEFAVCLEFEVPPPFVRLWGNPGAITMVAYRVELGGAPCGPWIEMRNHGHYEIEEAS